VSWEKGRGGSGVSHRGLQRLEQRRRRASDGDEMVVVNHSADKALEAEWSKVGGQDECGGELWCSGCLL
jgi:hypothetical protein